MNWCIDFVRHGPEAAFSVTDDEIVAMSNLQCVSHCQSFICFEYFRFVAVCFLYDEWSYVVVVDLFESSKIIFLINNCCFKFK